MENKTNKNEVGSPKSQQNSTNDTNDSKLYNSTDTISTTVKKTAECSEIISKIGDSNLALVSRNYTEGSWRNVICEKGMDGEYRNEGATIDSKKALWEKDVVRDKNIKKQFVKFKLCSDSGAKEKSALLEKIIDSISDEDKFNIMDITATDNAMPTDYRHVEGVTYQKFINKYKENYEIDDDSMQVITLATMLSNMMKDGDPVWLLIVAPASGGKTEIIRMLTPGGKPNKFGYPVSTLTPNTFVSGMEGNVDLLPRLDGKIFTIKDFTTILSMNADTRNAIMGQLRDIYDGSFAKETGSGVGRKSYETKLTMIAGVTPIIDKFGGLQSSMGERFIRIRQHAEPENEEAIKLRKRMTHKAAQLDFKDETPIRKELSNYVLSLLSDFEERWEEYKPTIDGLSLSMLEDCAEITAKLRTGIDKDVFGDIENKPEHEFTPRLVKSYKKLAISIAWLLGKKKVDVECLSFIYRVALDTVEKRRISVLRELDYEPQTADEISIKFGLSRKVTFKILDELASLKVINKFKMEEDKEEEDKKSNRGRPWMWSYNKDSGEIIAIERVEKFIAKLSGVRPHHANIIR